MDAHYLVQNYLTPAFALVYPEDWNVFFSAIVHSGLLLSFYDNRADSTTVMNMSVGRKKPFSIKHIIIGQSIAALILLNTVASAS